MMGTRILAIVACVIAVAAVAVGLLVRSALHTAENRQAARIERQGRQLMRLRLELSGLTATVSGLSRPGDPLSAYDQTCKQQLASRRTGRARTFYFPCTSTPPALPESGG
jgi:hypothetical protein